MFLHALRFGAALGATKIVVLQLAHAVFGVPALVSPATGLVMWTFVFGALVLAAWRLRVVAGGYQPLTTAIFHLCLVWVSGQALFTAWSVLLFHVIAPGLMEATVEPMRAIARQVGQRAQLPPDQIEAMVTGITRDTSPFSVAGQLRGYRDGLLPGILLSAVVAFPFRAKPDPDAEPAARA